MTLVYYYLKFTYVVLYPYVDDFVDKTQHKVPRKNMV